MVRNSVRGVARPWARRHNRRSNCRSDGFRPVQVSLVSCGVNVAVCRHITLILLTIRTLTLSHAVVQPTNPSLPPTPTLTLTRVLSSKPRTLTSYSGVGRNPSLTL